jgi:Fur family transcriptional regulator, zinc uptake regulator
VKEQIMSHECTHSDLASCIRPSSGQVGALMRQAETLCTERNQRFTELRRVVLELVCSAEQPVGAYQLLDELRNRGRSAAPPTVYRALDFLLQQGLVHRLASNNTYLACAHPQRSHAALFLVCKRCGRTQEIHTEGVIDAVKTRADEFGFSVEHASVEVSGLCHRCEENPNG